MNLTRIFGVALATAGLAITSGVFAQAPGAGYPSRPVRFVVPYAPGGLPDTVARRLARSLAERWGQSVTVDNRPGANGVVSAQFMMNAAADGYTLLVTDNSMFVINPALYTRLPYDARKDFIPISLAARAPIYFALHPSVAANNLAEFIALIKSKPGALSYGSSGIGTGGHLSAELFKVMTHTDMLHVPYKGGAQAATDLMGGHVSLMFATMSSVYQQAMSGKLRPVAITSAKRSPAAPKVPTVAESGVPEYETIQWIAMSAPRATPRNVIERLNAELVAGVKSPELRERLASQGYDPAASTPQELGDYIKVEFARFGKLIRTIALKDE